MKKIYSLVFALVTSIGFTNAQCTINPGAQPTPGVSPTAANLPCVERTVAYSQDLQVKIQDAGDTTLTIIVPIAVHIIVDSVRIDSVSGLPNGLTFSKNPNVLLGGGNGCGTISGTTNDPAGTYPLTAWGTAWLHGSVTTPIAFDTMIAMNGNLNQYSPFGGYYVVVVNQGAPCTHPAGINEFNADLNAALSVLPNPNNGQFAVNVNAGNRVNGEMVVVDMTGRIVYSQKLDVVGLYNTSLDLTKYSKGLYTVQLRTAEGVASKKISIQ
ncbi:MAG: T9SS type A sorting domain-containing protein [Bacteroidetes bacterium]|nr:T9SS type A sorting domain-containing protein [Bacteroidota bacterium]